MALMIFVVAASTVFPLKLGNRGEYHVASSLYQCLKYGGITTHLGSDKQMWAVTSLVPRLPDLFNVEPGNKARQ